MRNDNGEGKIGDKGSHGRVFDKISQSSTIAVLHPVRLYAAEHRVLGLLRIHIFHSGPGVFSGIQIQPLLHLLTSLK